MTTARTEAGLAALLALATIVGACTPEPAKPTPIGDVADGARYARDVAAVLLTYAAYDYALAGTLAGERTRVVTPERWAAVARANARSLAQLTSSAVSVSADAAGPVRDRLVAMADELTELQRESSAYADGKQPGTFAGLLARVTSAWARLRDLAQLLPPDPALAVSMTRGQQITATGRSDSRWILNVGPFATRAEADAAVRAISTSESVGTEAPFVIRVATFPTHAAAETKGRDLKGMPGWLVVEEQRWIFTRGPVPPDAELWREPARVFDTQAGARRITLSSDGAWIAVGSDDGRIALFSGEGVLRALPKLLVPIAHLAFADDAKTLIGGGVNLVVLQVPQLAQLGPVMTLTSPATQVLFVPAAASRSFVATARGPTGEPAGGGGVIGARAPDGVALGAPFPIVTPAAGAMLAVSDPGELFIATPGAGGVTDLEVLRVGFERAPRALVKVPGAVRSLVVDRAGSQGAMLTDQGLFRFDLRATDVTRSLRQSPAVREIAFGADGTFYALEQTKVSALDREGKPVWSAGLVDGRRILAGARILVLDGIDRVLVAGPTGSLDELGVGGTVTDLALSLSGKRVAVASGRRGLVFELP